MPGPPLRLPTSAELEEARAFVETWGGHAFTHVMFMGDKYLFYAAGRRALIDFADRYDRVPVFHEVTDRYLHRYHDHGFSLFKLGEQATKGCCWKVSRCRRAVR